MRAGYSGAILIATTPFHFRFPALDLLVDPPGYLIAVPMQILIVEI